MQSQVRRLLPYVSRYRRAFLFGLVFVIITTAFQLLAPWVLKFAIDDLNRGVTRQKLGLYAGLLLGVALVRGLFLFLMRRIIIGASRDIEYDIRNDFFARLEQLPLGYYHGRRTGDLMSRATNDLAAVRMMFGPAIMYSANTILVFFVAIMLMATIDTKLTLLALIPLPFVSVSVRYFGSAIHRRFEAIQAQLSEISAVVQEALAGVRVVRAYRKAGPGVCLSGHRPHRARSRVTEDRSRTHRGVCRRDRFRKIDADQSSAAAARATRRHHLHRRRRHPRNPARTIARGHRLRATG